MKKLSAKDIENIKIRVNTHENLKDRNIIALLNLCDQYISLLKENKALHEVLFDAEQSLPLEKQWQNILSAKLETVINSHSSNKEFVEIVNSVNNEPYLITIQRKFGATPIQLFNKSEIRRLKAVKKIISLKKDINLLKNTNKNLTILIEQIKISVGKFDSSDLSKEKIIQAIDYIKGLAKTYNIQVDNKVLYLKDTPISIKQSIQDAWRLASLESNRAKALDNEIIKLKTKLAKLKKQCVLYNKKRGTY